MVAPQKNSGIIGHLLDSVDEYRETHSSTYTDPATEEERRLYAAMNAVEGLALELIATGTTDANLEEVLAPFQPGANAREKVADLLRYNLVQERLEFAVAEDVLYRLRRLENRLSVATLGYSVLLRANPSLTATKYFQRAARLYLAGYEGEVTILCGAVLEAALAERFPDDLLRARGWTPKYAKTGVFAVGQRMKHEREHPIFTDEARAQFWEIVNWRNDAVHVQIDVGPQPERVLILTAAVLGLILPAVP